jgi:hypothetical protein
MAPRRHYQNLVWSVVPLCAGCVQFHSKGPPVEPSERKETPAAGESAPT